MKTVKIKIKSMWVIAGLHAVLLLRPAVLGAAVIAYDPFLNADFPNGGNTQTDGIYNAGASPFRDFTNSNNEDVVGGPIIGWSASSAWFGNSGASAGTYNKVIGPSDTAGLSNGLTIVQGGNVQARGEPSTGVAFARRALEPYAGSSTYYISALMSADAATISDNLTINAMTGFSGTTSSGAFDGSSFVGALFGFHGDGSEVDLVVRHRDDSNVTINSTLLNGVSGNTTYLVVLKIEYDAVGSSERLTAWVNPTSATEEDATAALITTGTVLTSQTQMTTGGFWIENFDSGSTDYLQFDELRMGTEWSDAVAVFEPANLSIQSGDGSVAVSSSELEPVVSNMLQVSDDLTNGIWSDVVAVVGTNSMNWAITPLSKAQSFYRIQSRLGGVHRFYQRAEPVSFHPDTPRLSDVCMRLFYIRGDITEERIITTGKDYHITRGSWSYINDAAFIAQVNSLGWLFQGTLNGHTYVSAYALRDDQGQPIVSSVGTRYWADPANTGYRAEYLQIAKDWIDNGATSLQRDDPDFGIWDWRGTRDAIPDAELLEFHSWARDEIEAYAEQTISMSVNAGGDRPFMDKFDYGMAEVRFDGLSPSALLNISRDARRYGRITVVTGQEDRPVDEFRLAWAGTYATGDLFMVPWDQFNREQVTDPSAERIFVEPAELADLTGFVRANALYLDGYEDAAIGGYDLVETRYGNEPPLAVEGGSGQLSAFLRARAGDATAPVVVHLVEWGLSAPAVIKLRSELLFGSSPVQVRLHRPPAYDAGAHALAETSKDYSGLSLEEAPVVTEQGGWTSIQVPELTPWGILVIEKQD